MTPVPVRLNMATLEEFLIAYTRDRALDGIHIDSKTPVPKGTLIDLTVEFPGNRNFRTLAVVQDPHPTFGIALKFHNLHPAYRQWLTDKVRLFAPEPPELEPMSLAEIQANHQLRKPTSSMDLAGAVDSVKPALSSQELVLGIDLGTSNSAACVVVDGKSVVIDLRDFADNRTAVRSIPSVVGIDERGNELLGQPALDRIGQNPRGTVFGAKRFIGRVYDSSEVQSMLSRFPYKIVPGPNGRVAVEVNGRPMALTSISARVLTYIRQRANQQLGRTLTKAIITVPAYYNENQRDAVVQAGRLAGLDVMRVLNEPTAAAVAYSLHRTQPRKLIVYDLGGGTFDVSIMQVSRDSLQVLATAGDTFLGGEDFDAVLLKYVLEAFIGKTRKPLSQNSADISVVKAAVEQAKRRLSTHDKTVVNVRTVTLADRTQAKLEIELSRQKAEQLVEPLVSRSLKICDMAMREARLDRKDIGDVILVGGQTLMPYVQQRVREHFKIVPRCDINPDEAVALGAGLMGRLHFDGGVELKDVLSMSIGVAIGGTRFKTVIERNTQVPCKRSVDLSVPIAELATYTISVWQGDQVELTRNEHLGDAAVNVINPGRSTDAVPIRVDFMLSDDCLLRVRLTHRVTEQSEIVTLKTRDSRQGTR